MTVQSPALGRIPLDQAQLHPVIDTDVHPRMAPTDPRFTALLPQRWRDYLDLIGLRTGELEAQVPRQRPFASRTDSFPPDGGIPGSDPQWAREQLLDAYDMSYAFLNNITAVSWARGTGNHPALFQFALASANNDWHHQYWLADDPRWLASINVAWEQPAQAVKEIERFRELDPRFCQ